MPPRVIFFHNFFDLSSSSFSLPKFRFQTFKHNRNQLRIGRCYCSMACSGNLCSHHHHHLLHLSPFDFLNWFFPIQEAGIHLAGLPSLDTEKLSQNQESLICFFTWGNSRYCSFSPWIFHINLLVSCNDFVLLILFVWILSCKDGNTMCMPFSFLFEELFVSLNTSQLMKPII